ncbi:MAG: TIGR03089 family protein [Hamadaea sp.]|nr:TIGR03089 family protein [Hamadaea sp.]
MPTVPTMFTAAVAADPARPLLTWYDDATGERTELSGATLANWVAKTANLLADGCGLGEGSIAAVRTPAHWQTAAIMLGAWTAGLALTHSTTAKADVAFVSPGVGAQAPDTFAVGLHPFALPVRDLGPGVQDWVTSARVHGDHYRGPLPPGDAPALVDLPGPAPAITHADLIAQATSRATELGLPAGARVLLDLDAHKRPVDWLLAPLAAGCTLVVCANADAAKLDDRAAVERAVRIP